MIRFLSTVFVWIVVAAAAAAQDSAWIQIEAHSTLTKAQERTRLYDAALDDVAGYSLGGRWYGIVLGPYVPDDATRLMSQLKQSGSIPSDSFVVFGNTFRQQFWPIGVGAQIAPQPLPAQAATATVATISTPAPQQNSSTPPPEEALPIVPSPDETPRQARASEALLDRDERRDLQIALQWAGHYDAAIDGAFGPGTRRSMSSWQQENGHEPTGILTTAQRIELLDSYNAVLDGMKLQLVRDEATGIEMLIPTGVVEFAEYEPPFAHFEPKGDLAARVLFISQQGDQNRLFGLYEILQTLEIVPTHGARTRGQSSFELEGIDSDIHSYTTAQLDNGVIKGFSLIWPTGDDERRRRVLQEMKASFNTIGGVLDPELAVPSESQAIDLVSGLAIRKPRLSQTGFYIDGKGAVLTTRDAIQGCDRITIDTEHDAEVIHADADLGVAVLRPTHPLAPLGVAVFQTGVPRLQSEVAVAGFPYGGVLVTPSLTFGRLADLRGLNGEEAVKRLSLRSQPGDVGGPVFDNGGAVLGMLLPKEVENGQVLPEDVKFSVDTDVILQSLSSVGLSAQTTDSIAYMSPGELTNRAIDTTVLVSCW